MKKFNLTIIIFILITLVGLFIRYIWGKDSSIWEFWSNLDISFAVALGILAFFAYKDMIKDEDEVSIHFVIGNEKKDTKLSLLRKDCTRSEILGVLGIIQKNPKERFILEKDTSLKLLDEVQAVQKAEKDVFEIRLTQKEFEQFLI